FDAVIKENKIYGLGSADVKLDFLCKLEALASFTSIESWKLPPVLVGTYSEESGMLGALKLIRRQKVNAKMAIIGEPSHLQLISAAKGFASIEIKLPFSPEEMQYKKDHNMRESTSTQSRIFKGKSAHSSTPHLGENAIMKLLSYLNDLPDGMAILEIDGGTNYNTVPSHAMLELDFVSYLKNPIKQKLLHLFESIQSLEKDFEHLKDPEFTPPSPTLNIGFIRTLEDHILISGNCRIPPIVTQSVYEKWMRQFQVSCEKIGGEFRVTDYKKPYRTQPESILIKGCLDELNHLGVKADCVTQSSTNEASLFSRTGIDCVCFGPGVRDGNIHTPNEHVSIDDLEMATAFYKKIIERFCL
ncbi:MAG: M20 family metallopeptidase, partial [Pseudobdellovibrionaceae bacterium]